MTRIQRLAAISAVAAAALVAACHESTTPMPLGDPTAMATSVTSLNSSFSQNAVFQSLMAITNGAVLAAPAVLPQLVPATRGASGAAQLRLMLRLAARSPTISLALFPSNVLGKTFQWDAAAGRYSITDSLKPGAPSLGVRFILYQVDTATQQPRLPLTTTGYVDLVDVSNVTSNGLHLLLQVGSQTAADYTVTEVKTTTSMTLTAVGYVQDVVTAGPKITFNLSHVLTLADSSLTTNYQASGNGASVSLQTSIASGAQAETFDWLLQRNGTVEAIGKSNADSTNIQVRLNGGTFATVRDITGGTTSLTGPDGRALTLTELTALESILEGFAQVFMNLGLVFVPTLLFFV